MISKQRRRPPSGVAVFPVWLLLVALAACAPPRQQEIRFQTTPVTRGDIQQRVTASGTLSAVVSVDVGSQVSGKIAELLVDFNTRVRKGQLVARIDPTVYEAALHQAQGELASTQAVLALKKLSLQRMQKLGSLKAVTQAEIDQAEAEAAQAAASVTIRQAAVQTAQANLGYCNITAPVDGIVISRKVDLGQTVNAAMSTPLLFTVAQDLRRMNITADVSEADIGQVQVGDAVDFTVDAFPTEIFRGTVSQVRRAPITTQNVVTYATLIAVDNREEKLFPGMTADVSILVAKRDQALLTPNAALRFTPPMKVVYENPPPASVPRGTQLLYTVGADGLKLRAVPVRVGISDGRNSEILSGVEAGTPVVISSSADNAQSFPGFPGPG